MSYATETGASSWLNALPIHEHGFALHKGAFRDAICLRYGWHPSGLSSTCACSKSFTVEHAMNCPTGGFPTMRHNERLQILRTVQDWMCLRMVFGVAITKGSLLMLKCFNPNASSYKASSLSSLYRRFEKEKQRKYEQRIREVEMGCFTPLVFSTFGGMSTICNIFSRDLPPCLLTRGTFLIMW